MGWGIYASMDARPGQTRLRLMNGWDSEDSALVSDAGSVLKTDTEIYYPGGSRETGLLGTLDRSGERVAVTDRYGWLIHFANNSLFLYRQQSCADCTKRRRICMAGSEDLFYIGKRPENGRFHIYVISDVPKAYIFDFLAGILVAVAADETGWVLFSKRRLQSAKDRGSYISC